MKVKIIKAGYPTFWYANRIGEVFDVVPSLGDFRVISKSGSFLDSNINYEDCIEIGEVSEDKQKIVKPLVGLRPRYIADSLRIKEIVEAINRYVEVDKAIPQEWLDELSEINSLKGLM